MFLQQDTASTDVDTKDESHWRSDSASFQAFLNLCNTRWLENCATDLDASSLDRPRTRSTYASLCRWGVEGIYRLVAVYAMPKVRKLRTKMILLILMPLKATVRNASFCWDRWQNYGWSHSFSNHCCVVCGMLTIIVHWTSTAKIVTAWAYVLICDSMRRGMCGKSHFSPINKARVTQHSMRKEHELVTSLMLIF